jgi:hypothetical protein
MSTLISDLEGTPAITDGDFVQSIMNEMNMGSNGGGGQGPPVQPPPAIGGPQQGVISAPNPNSFASRAMDSNPPTAHMIGNSQPTAADFAEVMSGAGAIGSQNPAVLANQFGGGAPFDGPQRHSAPVQPYVPRKSWWSRILDELRAPVGVAILVFLFSLPVVNFLFAHYIPWMVKPTGELTMIGLLIKSGAAGFSYWILQRVVVPLLSL